MTVLAPAFPGRTFTSSLQTTIIQLVEAIFQIYIISFAFIILIKLLMREDSPYKHHEEANP